MELIFILIGALSLAYGAVIFVYTGMTSFLWFWPVFGVVNFAMLALVRYMKSKRRKKEEIRLYPCVCALTSYAIGVTVLGILLGTLLSGMHSEPRQNLDYMIVLGSELDGSRISVSLKRRLDAAAEYHKENPQTIFVLSGGKGPYDRSTESTVMYYYLIRQGVPDQNLLLEFYSESLREQLGYSYQVILEDREQEHLSSTGALLRPGNNVIKAPVRPVSIGIMGSELSLYRARRSAEDLNMPVPATFGTAPEGLLYVHACVREAIMIFKDMLMGNI